MDAVARQRTNSEPDVEALKRQAAELRGQVIWMSHKTGAAHLASCLSAIDVMTAAYWHALRIDPTNPTDPLRDRFILSKGHAAMALYSTLAFRGYFSRDLLDTYNQDGGMLAEHPPANLLPGVEAATGSLGHGLPIAAGHALAARVKGNEGEYRVYALLSDGECNEGSVWEAAMFAAGMKLSNLCVVVDYNKWQATARYETLALSPLREKWESFGWDAHQIDGHDIGAVARALANFPNGSGKPVAFIADTVKGKGVSFMEDDNNWHYRAPTAEEVEKSRKELGLA
jgi:transketolase